jgi:gliding motility-associated-like protein
LLSPTPTSITPTATLCLGDTLTLQATGGGTYTWAANSQLPAGSSAATLTLQPTAASTYSVVITDVNGCTATHTEQVYIDVVNYTVSLPTDTVLYQGAALQVSASNGTAYQWQPGGQTTQQINIAPNADVQLIVQATDANGCNSSDTMLVRVVPSYFVLPTAFSPDGDHINDVYLPVYSGVERLESLKIFNRWGKKIFETNSSTQGWDGTYEGVAQPLGTYMAVCVTLSNLGTQLTTSGNVTLVK